MAYFSTLARLYKRNADSLELHLYRLVDHSKISSLQGNSTYTDSILTLMDSDSSAPSEYSNNYPNLSLESIRPISSLSITLDTSKLFDSSHQSYNIIQEATDESLPTLSFELSPLLSTYRESSVDSGAKFNQNPTISLASDPSDYLIASIDESTEIKPAWSFNSAFADLHNTITDRQSNISQDPIQISGDLIESYLKSLSLPSIAPNQLAEVFQRGFQADPDASTLDKLDRNDNIQIDEYIVVSELEKISALRPPTHDLLLPPGVDQANISGPSNSILPLNKYYIYQSDIDNGTLILDKQGHYIVMEDLVFNPNPVGMQVFGVDAARLGLSDGDVLDSYRSGRPLASQLSYAGGAYDPKAYGIGFFAMMSVLGSASGSVLDLNGFTIEQSEEHALQQRFFSVIELAGAPFITGQGPHDFGPTGNNAVSNFEIRNGKIGRSAHHGIHGNGNQNIFIRDVDFEDYEVAAVALNGVNGLFVNDVSASNSIEIPVNGAYSNARFISSYVDYLASLEQNPNSQHTIKSLNVNGATLSASRIQKDLESSLNSVFSDIIVSGDGQIDQIDSNYYLYNNQSRLIDGNSYGFLVGPVGVQVNGFPDPPPGGFQTPSENVNFTDVRIKRQHSNVTEVAVLSNNTEGGMINPVIDPVGASFMLRNNMNGIYNTLETAEGSVLTDEASDQDVLAANYKPNVLANAQLLVAKNKHAFANSFLDVSRMSIGDDIVAWAESDASLSELRATLNQQDGWIYNTDNMVHVQKGTIGFKIDGVTGATLTDVRVDDLHAQGGLGFNGNYEKGFVLDTATGYNGADAYGFTFSGSTDVIVKDAKVNNVSSQYGEAFGFASPLNNSTNISITDATVTNLTGSGLDAIGPNPAGISSDFLNV